MHLKVWMPLLNENLVKLFWVVFGDDWVTSYTGAYDNPSVDGKA